MNLDDEQSSVTYVSVLTAVYHFITEGQSGRRMCFKLSNKEVEYVGSFNFTQSCLLRAALLAADTIFRGSFIEVFLL